MRISAHVSPELQAMLTRIIELPAEARKQLRVATKRDALPIWQEEVGANVHSRLDALIFGRTARVAVTDKGVRLQAARIGKPLSGGLDIKSQWYADEFGADREAVRKIAMRSPKGKQYTATRHTQRQLPARAPKGRVAFPAVADSIPRIMSLWMQTVTRAGHEALEGKR